MLATSTGTKFRTARKVQAEAEAEAGAEAEEESSVSYNGQRRQSWTGRLMPVEGMAAAAAAA